MAFSPDYYSVLGVSPSADRAAIHSAWRALLRRYHPDANHGADVSARAKEINEAYAVLGKKEPRAAYDRSRSTTSSRRPTAHRPVYAASAGRRSTRPSATMRPCGDYSQPFSTNDWLTGLLLLILTAAPLGTIVVLYYEESRPTYTARRHAAVHHHREMPAEPDGASSGTKRPLKQSTIRPGKPVSGHNAFRHDHGASVGSLGFVEPAVPDELQDRSLDTAPMHAV
ncbi:J domain-containing protein [Sphingomonas sp. Tas61C01]|uniref:J domain-containing protein n=1 Tax=Sphingomonas sp. Tas61C01 TaxID=3458297 RepID=UPI00403ECDEE